MAETEDTTTAAARATNDTLLHWLAPFAITLPVAAVCWKMTGEFRLDVGVVAAAIALFHWRGYVSAVAGLLVAAAIMAPSATARSCTY